MLQLRDLNPDLNHAESHLPELQASNLPKRQAPLRQVPLRKEAALEKDPQAVVEANLALSKEVAQEDKAKPEESLQARLKLLLKSKQKEDHPQEVERDQHQKERDQLLEERVLLQEVARD